MTTGSLGGSKVRPPNPSAMKMRTFCSPPLVSVTTSNVGTRPECCLAQLGSAAMLIGLALGTVPSNLTTPLMPDALVLPVDGDSARITWRGKTQIIKAIKTKNFFIVITHLVEDKCLQNFCGTLRRT